MIRYYTLYYTLLYTIIRYYTLLYTTIHYCTHLCCHMFLAAAGDDPPLCCDSHQVSTFANNMGAPKQFLSRCPSCYQNFLDLFCYTTCYPNASTFMTVSRDQWVGNRDQWVVSRDQWVVSRDQWVVSRDQWVVSRDQ